MHRYFHFLLAIIFTLLLSGCHPSASVPAQHGQPSQSAVASAPAGAQQTGTAYTVKDDAGDTLTLPHKPMRLVSLTYGTDEILAATVEPERILAYSHWADDTGISCLSEAERQAVKGRSQDNAEMIAALHPDLVVASIRTDEQLVTLLKKMNVPLYRATTPKNWQDMQAKVLNLATAVGEKQRGEAVIRDMDTRLAKLEEQLKDVRGDKRKTALVFNFTGVMGRKGDLIDVMLGMSHVVNGAEPYQKEMINTYLSKEKVMEIDPDIIFLPTWGNGKHDVDRNREQFIADPAYSQLRAVRSGALLMFPERYFYVASQHMIDSVEELARMVYPEQFGK